MKFSHLHVHTQFSLLDGAADISKLYKKAAADGMPALAITDHGNMFGVFQFVAEAYKHKNDDGSLKVKPIVGCEFYLVEDRHKRQFTKEDRDVRYHQLFLAKNEIGYKNLCKLCSLGYIEGLYGKYPRIDKELVLQYHEGLIATTCCLGAEVPRTILKKGEAEGEKVFKWWLDLFGEDYYVELQRHDIPDQIKANEVLLRFAAKYNVPVIASNDSHYVDQQDSNAHDILLCINTGEKQSTPSMKEFSDDDTFTKGKRFAFYNDQFYFKTTSEMSTLFNDVPQAIDNTNAIVDKIETLDLKRQILLPNFPVPQEFASQDDYLRHLTFTGAKERYGEISQEVEERLNFELHTIQTMGFAGYFLIVADFIKAGRDIGVFVGPGRGSAAGSAVAYCIGITNIDPIKYNLLFERFLNPERKSMPDIDTDFDDEGRQKVIDYVVQKYGRNQVAQIVTYGSMAAKLSIKDVARVLDLPLQDSNALTKLVPDRPGIKLDRVLRAPLDGDGGLKDKEGVGGDDLENVKRLRQIYEGKDLAANVLKEALVLEGSVRGTGIHAAGIIIAPDDLSNLIPVATAKDSDLLVTQYEGNVIEDAGVIKMDFLGLKTLTIIRDALVMIKENYGVEIDPDEIPLTDTNTYELYQRGETNGTFQFESAGMQKYLRDLKPDQFEDLIAMNALYRPGPLEYIPNFIRRKHGLETISYDLPEMEEYLAETYGITVYQEQVMLLSQKLAGFTKGEADTLRKAMGKKQKEVLDKMKSKFIEGAKEKGHPKDKLEKIWTDWEAFAQYAFNKSHSTCYAFVAYQTAYLKAHYPAEYMASVLTHNQSNIDKISFFMDECRRMGMKVLGPDVNESSINFSVNQNGEIRFGLGAIKGVGENAVEAIVQERKENGPYKDIFDLVKRVNLRTVNKKTVENLVLAGAFDGFHQLHRAQFYATEQPNSEVTFLEKLLRWGAAYQAGKDAAQVSLFGESQEADIPEPVIPQAERWFQLLELSREKEVTGFYISGHPLDEFRYEIENYCNLNLSQLTDLKALNGRNLNIAGIVSSAQHKFTQKGAAMGVFVLEDYYGSHEFALFNEDYLKYKYFLEKDNFLFIQGRVQPRFRNSDQMEVSIVKMELLSEIRRKKSKQVLVNIPVHELKEDLMNSLDDIFTRHPGEIPVKFKVWSSVQDFHLDFTPRTIKVDIGNDFIAEMGKIPSLQMKIV